MSAAANKLQPNDTMPPTKPTEAVPTTKKVGPNVIVLSEAGKPIFSRWGNEDDLAMTCALVQTIRASTVDDDSFGLGDIQSIRSDELSMVFLSVGALTLIAVSELGQDGDCETEAYLRLQLEYVYGQIIFTLTEQVQSIFKTSPNFDLRNMLGATDSVMLGILDQAGPLGNGGPFLTAGVETVCPIPPTVREDASRAIEMIGGQTENTLFAFLLVGNKLVTLVQPDYRPHQLRPSDLHLILNFINYQPGLLTNELWFPICLPRFNSSGFLYAYTNCLHPETALSLVLVSQQNTTEQFDLFRGAAAALRQQLGLPKLKSSVMKLFLNEGDSERKEQHSDDAADQKENDTVCEGSVDTKVLGLSQSDKSSLTDEDINASKSCPLVRALQQIGSKKLQESMINRYCSIASALHFIFRCDVSIGKGNPNKNEGGGLLTQCLSPTLGFPFVDAPSKQRVWNTYQRLSLRLRLGSASLEATMDAFDMITEDQTSGGNKDGECRNSAGIGRDCPAICLMESPPNVHGVTYILDGCELFVGLNGRDFELYAVLPGTIPPRNGTALCARLVRRLMCEEKNLFVANPLTWQE